jgi:hypothetical protein
MPRGASSGPSPSNYWCPLLTLRWFLLRLDFTTAQIFCSCESIERNDATTFSLRRWKLCSGSFLALDAGATLRLHQDPGILKVLLRKPESSYAQLISRLDDTLLHFQFCYLMGIFRNRVRLSLTTSKVLGCLLCLLPPFGRHASFVSRFVEFDVRL